MIVIYTGNGAWIPYTAAAALTYIGYQVGVSLTTTVPGNPITIQTFGPCPYDLINLGAGSESAVVVTGTGAMSRGTTGLVIGIVDPAGAVCIFPTRISSGYGIIHTRASFGTPTTGQSPVLDASGKFIFQTVLQTNSVTGTGLWHSTTGTLDTAAYIGALDTILVTNHADTATAWIAPGGDVTYASSNFTVVGLQTHAVAATSPTEGQFLIQGAANWAPTTLTQDVTASVTTPGQMDVVGLLTHALPGLSAGYLQWTGAAWAFGGGGSVISWANDLAGSTNSNQYVASISGNAGGGGAIPVYATSLAFDKAQVNPSIKQLALAADAATNTLSFIGQSCALTSTINKTGGAAIVQGGNGPTSNATGGSVYLNAPQGGGTGANGAVLVQSGGITVVQISNAAVVGANSNTAISFGSTLPSSTTAYSLLGDGSSFLTLNSPTTLNLAIGGTSRAIITSSQVAWSVVNHGGDASQVVGSAAYGFTSTNGGGAVNVAGNISLNAAQASTPIIQLTGTVGAGGVTLTVPNYIGAFWLLDFTNVTLTGTLTITTGSGTTVTIAASSIIGKLVPIAVVANHVLSYAS